LAEQQATEKRAADKKKADKEKRREAQRAEEKRQAAEDPFGDFEFDIDFCPCGSGRYYIVCCLDNSELL